MTCKLYENRLTELEDYLDGCLAPEPAQEVAEHVAACESCREALQQAGWSARLVRAGVEPVAEASGFFWTRLSARVRAEEEKRRARRDFAGALEWLAWRTATAGVMVVVLLGSYLVFGLGLPHQMDKPTVQAEGFPEPEHPGNEDDVLVTLAARPNGR